MRDQRVSSQVAWSEREGKLRSAKRSAAALVATLAALLIFCSSHAASPAELQHEPWIEKDWTRWTYIDCENVLNSSPWGKSNKSGAGDFTMGGAIQFTSALPIRRATIREAQIWAGYDRMDASKKQTFDQKHPQDMEESDTRPILIYVANGVAFNTTHRLRGAAPEPFPGGQAILKLSDGNVVMPTSITGQINEHGNLVHYSFPRIVNGKPTYTGNDRSIEIFFGGALWIDKHGNVVPHEQKMFPLNAKDEVKFPIALMIYNGKLEY
jgi:hypothetical protein